jgi:hypothetical protein
MAIKKRMRDGTIKYISYKHEDNEKVPSETLLEEDHRDKEIARLTALVDTLTKEIEKQSKPKEEEPSSSVMAVAAASTYSCYN